MPASTPPSRVPRLAVGCCAFLVLLLVLIASSFETAQHDFMSSYDVRRSRDTKSASVSQNLRNPGAAVVDSPRQPHATATNTTTAALAAVRPPVVTAAADSDTAAPNAALLAVLRQWNTTRDPARCTVDFSKLHPQRLPRHAQGRCFVSDRYRLVYVAVPKAGSSTSRDLCNLYGFERTTWSALSAKQRGYFSFAFWRDPLSRMPSGYSTLLSRAHDKKDEILRFVGGGGAAGSDDKAAAALRDRLYRDMYANGDGFYRFIGAYWWCCVCACVCV
jgi:hypothetical protein